MERNSVLLTDSPIDSRCGGGIVSLNLLEVLREISAVKLILSGQHFPDSKYDGIPAYCIKANQFGYSDSDPFFSDVFSKAIIESSETPYDLTVSYGCPWQNSFEYLKDNQFIKLIADLAPHDVNISREEHMRLNGSYPFSHLTNEFLFKRMYLKHLRLADLVIVHSKSSSEYIQKTAELKNQPLVIPHGAYLPKEIPELPKEFRPMYMGSLGADKGIIYLINGVVNSKKGINLILAGGESQHFSAEDKYKERFIVYGPVDSFHELYKKTSVGVFPSVTEGFGICGLECMSYGRPVIVSTGTGVADLIQDGREGFVIPIRDSNAIKTSLEWFNDNPTEVRRMGRNARETSEKYGWESIKKQYKDAINALY